QHNESTLMRPAAAFALVALAKRVLRICDCIFVSASTGCETVAALLVIFHPSDVPGVLPVAGTHWRTRLCCIFSSFRTVFCFSRNWNFASVRGLWMPGPTADAAVSQARKEADR